jgi:hypothetical protein
MWSISNYIDTNILPLKPSDKVLIAKDLMLSQNVFNLPIIDEGKLLLWVDLETLCEHDDKNNISQIEFPILSEDVVLREEDHFFKGLQIFKSNSKLDLLPVFSRENEYKGLVRARDLITPFLVRNVEEGESSVVLLEMNDFDYSLAALCNIVEYNRSAILQVLVGSHVKGKIWVHLVLNTTIIQSILSSFYRYNYNILFVHNQKDVDTLIDDRYQSLMKYLDL